MTAPAWRVDATPGGNRRTRIDTAAWCASVFLLVTFSQAWVFPLMGENADPSVSGLIRTLYIPAYIAGLFLLVLAPGEALRGLARQPFLILLMVVVAFSAVWSVAPDQTARRIVALYFTTLCSVALAARWRWPQLAEIIATGFAILAVVSFLAGALAPHIGRMETLFPGAWRGLWAEKNAFGGNMALAFVMAGAAGALNPRRALMWWGFAGLALLLVMLSTSKTSLVSLVLGGGGLLLVALLRRGPVMRVATVWASIVGVLMIAGTVLFAVDLVFDLLGKDATLTGRTQIWAAAMHQIAKHPWTGVGYGVAWDDIGPWGPLATMTSEIGFRAQHAHNAWLEQWLGLGVVGLAIFALFYVQTIAMGVIAAFRSRGAWLAVPFLIVYTLITFTESVAVTYNDLHWVLCVAIAVRLVLPEAPYGEAPPRR